MTRLMVAALVYPMVQAVLFGAGLIAALAAAPTPSAQWSIPLVVVVTALVSLPASWFIAPRLMARYQRRPGARTG
ncbi:hypothetical protein [Phenylobacterium sp.]|uniref:hypothetical protein n=1 Tax=Phenylobacterium sp. TaxID=1871053 RepID=UPI00261A6461|nr:hypothetical protein [Phenylobacterium sp.]